MNTQNNSDNATNNTEGAAHTRSSNVPVINGIEAALLYFQELLDSVETLSGIADKQGTRMLADLFYLQNVILKGGFIEHQAGESKVLEMARLLPSGEQWSTFIKVN